MKDKKIAIIGGGIIGLATAYKLSLLGAEICVFEKEEKIGLHQSGRNSGVLHCGLAYQPGSLKAQLSVNGVREMISFCKEHKIQHDVCGKIVVATNDQEEKTLEDLASRGKKNGLLGLQYLTKSELEKREPYVRGQKTLLVPEEGIVDYKGVMKMLVELIQQNGGDIRYQTRIEKIEKQTISKLNLKTEKGEVISFDYLISCSGLWSDVTYKKLTLNKPPLKIVPFRGEYMKFKKAYQNYVNHLIYPVPNPSFPFLGVHFTRMISGEREVGPNAVLALKREGYSKSSFSFQDAIDSLTYSGLRRFVSNNLSFSANEFSSSIFKKSFIKKAQKMIPDINSDMLESCSSGVRAQAISTEGKLQMDFNVIREGQQIHILNAPSPGATASLAIASYIIDNYLLK